MNNKVLYVLFLCSCFLNGQNNTKQISFGALTVEDGLSQNSVVSIAQDSTGFMWFATQDGLNKYDGRSFIQFNKQFEDVTRPTYSKLGKIYVDRTGEIWIITNSGQLEYFNSETETFSRVNTIPKISLVFRDKAKNLYLGTYGEGVLKIRSHNQDTIQIFKKEDAQRMVNAFLEYKDELLIAASGNVFSYKNDKYSEITVEGNSNYNFSALAATKSETLWLGSYGHGLFYRLTGETDFKPYSTLPQTLNIQDVLVDKNDRTWIATYGQGVYVIEADGTSIRHFKANKSNPYALHYNDVLCLYEDFTGTVWLGTDGAGLSYYDEHLLKFNVLTNNQLPEKNNIDVIRAITVDDKKIYVGTSGKGLTVINRANNNSVITYTTKNSKISSNRIMSLLTADGKLLIGHQGQGLDVMFNNGDIKSVKAFKDMTIWKLYKATNQDLWLCTRNNGLLRIDSTLKITQQFNAKNSALTTNNIRTIEEDENGNLWIGTEADGLFMLDASDSTITRAEGVSNKIKSLLFDNNILWVGTNGNGLEAYDINTKTVNRFTSENGLPNNVIYGILKDDLDNLWLSSNKGITRFTIEGNSKPSIKNYSSYDGLQALEFNTGAYFKDSLGYLYFGGLEGLNWFKPKDITFNTSTPKTIITKLELFNEPIELQQNQYFKHGENTFTFTFSGLHFSQPERNLYKYKLVNNDAEWIEAKNNNVAHYTNLPPNDYEFQVVSSNYDGVWNTTPATYKFSILKPWYATNFAKACFIILQLLVLYGIYRYLKFRWKVKTQLQLEHAETERLKKLDEFKTKLYTNISHEFRTPLTLISGPVDKQLERENLTETDKKELNLVRRNANRLLSLVNQMMDLSLVDSGQLQLKVSTGDLSVLVNQIVAAFQYKSKDKSMVLQSDIEIIEAVYFDADILEKVVSNLLSNAIKYAPDGSIIKVDLSRQNDVAVFSVVNTYENVRRKNLTQMFQRFYQDNEASDGVGVGLALVKELVNLSKGTVIANTLDDNTIQISVTLPIIKDAFLEHEIINDQDSEAIEHSEDSEKFTDSTKQTLLIVEDEKDIREFIVSIFKGEYRLLTAADGNVGIAMATKHLPDIIISDIMMPISDGIALCNAIKRNVLTSHIPIVLLTAKVDDDSEIAGLKTGADAYITKPFNTKKLLARVEQLLQSRQQLKSHYGNTFSINPELAITDTETEFLKALKAVLDEYITNSDFTSEQFSQLMLMSRTQLHRKLKAIAGQSTSEFIRSQRLHLASELLKTSDVNVSEVAYKVGFNSPSYFIKCFKKQYGCTPSEFHNHQ